MLSHLEFCMLRHAFSCIFISNILFCVVTNVANMLALLFLSIFCHFIYIQFIYVSVALCVFQSLFSFFKIFRFPLTLSIAMYTKLFCIITHFTIIIWLITKILLVISIYQLASNVFAIYPPFVQNNDITCRVIMFP